MNNNLIIKHNMKLFSIDSKYNWATLKQKLFAVERPGGTICAGCFVFFFNFRFFFPPKISFFKEKKKIICGHPSGHSFDGQETKFFKGGLGINILSHYSLYTCKSLNMIQSTIAYEYISFNMGYGVAWRLEHLTHMSARFHSRYVTPPSHPSHSTDSIIEQKIHSNTCIKVWMCVSKV